MVFTLSIRKQGREVSFKSKKRKCIAVNSQFNGSRNNISNASNSDYAIGNPDPPRINNHTKSSF